MSEHVAGREYSGGDAIPGLRSTTREISGYWWLQLIAGISWLVISLVILQFDAASITTVGLLIGLMFTFSAVQNFVLAGVTRGGARWVSAIFGVLFAISTVICLVEPQATFAAVADSLGFLFLIVGMWWMTRAFLERAINTLWWLGLISGILMTIMAFWTSGQFFVHRAYTLLVFAGIWALMQGVTDIARAFAVRGVHEEVQS